MQFLINEIMVSPSFTISSWLNPYKGADLLTIYEPITEYQTLRLIFTKEHIKVHIQMFSGYFEDFS
jgi:hypothetical protein